MKPRSEKASRTLVLTRWEYDRIREALGDLVGGTAGPA